MFAQEIKENRHIYGLVILYIAAGWALAAFYGVTERFSVLVYSRPVLTTTFMLGALFLGYVVFRIMFTQRPKRLSRAILTEIKEKWATSRRLGQGLPMVIAFMFFIAAFSSVKSMIPVVQPYGAWDQFFYEWENTLHFGIDPWRLLQPALGYPLITFIINLIYNLWFPVMFAVLYWQAFTMKSPELRKTFFLSFYACWIINGSILAILLSSVGPCFYGLLYGGGEDPYTPLIEYLKTASESFPIWALQTQDMLWQVYQANELSFGSGISAMPSLHVSIAFLQVLFGYQISKFWGRVFLSFFVVILIGSVHLAWHYAIDGYLSILTTALIWWGVRKLNKHSGAGRNPGRA